MDAPALTVPARDLGAQTRDEGNGMKSKMEERS
jgi:hypothetical protein